MPKLRTVRPGVDLGYRRTRVGAGFRYTDADGGALPDAERERAVALVIPPAWTDVWISAAPNGHIQATGIDGAGRLQYLYHPDWSTGRDKGKYARALQLAGSLPRARGRVTTSLRRADLDRERVLATAFRLLDLAAPRVGSERYLVTHGHRQQVELASSDADAADFDALVLPGGVVNADKLRMDEASVAFAKAFFAQHKPVGAICHAAWTLVEGDVVRGRTLTSYPSLQTDLRNAGATWVDEEVVVDEGFVTSRTPGDLPAFNAKLLEEFAEGEHAEQTA